MSASASVRTPPSLSLEPRTVAPQSPQQGIVGHQQHRHLARVHKHTRASHCPDPGRQEDGPGPGGVTVIRVGPGPAYRHCSVASHNDSRRRAGACRRLDALALSPRITDSNCPSPTSSLSLVPPFPQPAPRTNGPLVIKGKMRRVSVHDNGQHRLIVLAA